MIKRLLVLTTLGFFAQFAHAEVINIDNADLVRLTASGVPLVDIRTEGEWKDDGVVAGSKLLTFFDEAGRSDPPQWLEKLKAVTKHGQPVILVCRSGRRSSAAAQFLSAEAGYKTVYNVSKGMNGWVGEGRPVVPAALPK
jgi:rhodanese-related sulfurtransferase